MNFPKDTTNKDANSLGFSNFLTRSFLLHTFPSKIGIDRLKQLDRDSYFTTQLFWTPPKSTSSTILTYTHDIFIVVDTESKRPLMDTHML